MKETEITRMIRASLERAGAWAYKIPDHAFVPGRRRANIPRPFDLVACYRGELLAIEVKLLRGYQAFGMRHLRESQIEHLERVVQAGGRAYVFCVVWEPRQYKRLLIWPWDEFPREASIRKRELQELPYLDHARCGWPMTAWLNNESQLVASGGPEATMRL